MKISLAFALGLFLSAGVAYAASDWLSITGSIQVNTGTITKITDTKSKVDCYAYRDQYTNSLSCVKQ